MYGFRRLHHRIRRCSKLLDLFNYHGFGGHFHAIFSTGSSVASAAGGREFIGRVFGVAAMISGMMMPLGMLLFGPLADVIPSVDINSHRLLMVIEGFILLGNKALLEAGKPIEESDK